MGVAKVPSAIFSFFSGAGFLDLGFEDEGFDVVFANEYNESFASAYTHARISMKRPLPKHGVQVSSVDEWLGDPYATRLKRWIGAERRLGRSVGFIGGPPCPDFSIAGKNRGQHGENGRLTRSYFNLINSQRPDWFLFENVKGLWRTHRHKAFFNEMLSLVKESGYCVSNRLINSIEYGAPQDRDRIITVGLSKKLCAQRGFTPSSEITEQEFPWNVGKLYDRSILDSVNWPSTDDFGNNPKKPESVPAKLTVRYWFERNGVAAHPNAIHGFRPRAGLARFKTVAEGDDSRKSFKRLHRWRYSPTAAYGNNEVHLHPTEPRRITVAEALAVQSLPETFTLPPSMTLSAMFKTVGNGVPYLAAKGLAQMVKKCLL